MQVSTMWRERIRSSNQKPDFKTTGPEAQLETCQPFSLDNFHRPITKSSFSSVLSQGLADLSGPQRFAHSFEDAHFTRKPKLARGPLISAAEKPSR